MKPWYIVDNADSIDTPALVIYPERVQRNIEKLKSLVPDTNRLRPHIKTNKCAEVIRMMLDAGITRFKCATVAEAELAADAGVRDMLLSYQPTLPRIARFCELIKRFPDTMFSCLIDNMNTLSQLSDAADREDLDIDVYIDLNVGMNRTGIVPGSAALELARAIHETPRVSLVGLHAYDGHLRDPDLEERTRKCDEAFEPVYALAREVEKATTKYPALVAGGTPTFAIHARREDVEVSPGTFIFWDNGYGQILKEQPFEFAALVLTRVVSKPTDHRVSADLGHKSIASENALDKRVAFLNASGLTPVGHSEEHFVLEHDGSSPLQVGDLLYGVPHHICPTVALYDEATVVHDHRATDTWSIGARRKRITI